MSQTETTDHILVVDDQRDIREPLARYLDRHGLRTSQAGDAATARRLLRDAAVDLVVLDIMMPGEDGLSLCRHLRTTTDVPVILLTALGEETDRVVGLEVGADDYVTKPFNPRELLARIRTVMRRTRAQPPLREADLGPQSLAAGRQLPVGHQVLDTGRRELIDSQGVATPLSTAEFRLLTVFLNRPGQVLSRDQLLDLTAGREAVPFDRSIDNQVSRLRRKVEADPKAPTLIKTIWGGGYQYLPADPLATP